MTIMNNIFEHIMCDRTIPNEIKLENESSAVNKFKRKRKMSFNHAEDEEMCNIRSKKVKVLGPIVISELSKAFVNEQSQVYCPTWLTHFPTVRLKMVTGGKNGNCVLEKNVFGDGKTWDAKLTELDSCKDANGREIQTKKIKPKMTKLKFEEKKDLVLGTKSALKVRYQPVVVLKKIDTSKYASVKIENTDHKQKEISDGERQNEVQSTEKICGKALTDLLRRQRFPKPVVCLKLLGENEINYLKCSVLKDDKGDCTGTKTKATSKLTMFSSMEPVSRLRKIMETIEISSLHTEKRKEIKTHANSKIKGRTENIDKQVHPRKCVNLKLKNEKSASDEENVTDPLQISEKEQLLNPPLTKRGHPQKILIEVLANPTGKLDKKGVISVVKKLDKEVNPRKSVDLEVKNEKFAPDVKNEKSTSDGENVTDPLQISVKEKEELQNLLLPKRGRPRKIVTPVVANPTGKLDKKGVISVVKKMDKEVKPRKSVDLEVKNEKFAPDKKNEKSASDGENVTDPLQISVKEKEELQNSPLAKRDRTRKIVTPVVANPTSKLNQKDVISVVEILDKEQFPKKPCQKVGRPLKSAKEKMLLSDYHRKNHNLRVRVKRLGQLTKWQNRDNVKNERISSNSVKVARKLLKTAKINQTEGHRQRPKTTNRLPQKFKTASMNKFDLRHESKDTEEKAKIIKPMDKRKNSEKEGKEQKAKIINTVDKRKNSEKEGKEQNDKKIKSVDNGKRSEKEGQKEKPKKIKSVERISRTVKKMRCRQCENCLRPNCGKCIRCVDMKRFGGPNITKQCCVNRRCLFREYLIKQTKLKPPSFTLTPKLQRFLQSKKPFLQDQPCWKLPLKLNQCRQCANDFTYNSTDGILCRFYLFRRLVFKDDNVLTPVGFAESSAATKNDLKLLDPNPEEPANLDLDTSKFILHYVGDQFCGLVEHEKRTRRRFITKDIVVKRAIQGVREMCDVCDTTIFNFHFSCGKCGFVVCIDCYDGDEALWMACHRISRHVKDELMLTQTIPGDILWALNTLTHKICDQNGIAMSCSCVSKENNKSNTKKSKSVCKPLMEQISQRYNDTKKSACSSDADENELPRETNSPVGKSESDRKPLRALTTIINCVIDQFFSGGTFDAQRHIAGKYPDPVKGGKEYSSRIFTLSESRSMFPGVPHSWLCEGRLLWLHEPQHSKNVPLFQEIWKRGQPILVSNVHKHLDENLWHPKAFSRDFGELENDLIDCLSGSVLHELMKNFWDGFQDPEKRLKDKDGNHLLLKLKDWPPGDDFSEVLPTRFQDLMKALPLPDYTHRDGKLNLTARLPDYFVPPDLGPKLYIAYGSTQYPSQGTTNLHLDMSDAVNVMVYAGVLKDENKKAHIEEAYQAVCEAGCDILARKRVKQKGVQLGAIWHIFKANDAPKIRKLLNALAIEKGEQPEAKSDPIHDQRWYLDSNLRHRLYTEYGVDGYAIAQCVGDAVFIPAGAPHQVRNLHSCIKVAEDFVTPENIGHCLKLTQEFRHLSNSHSNHEDKLQVKNIAYHAVKDSLSVVMATQSQT